MSTLTENELLGLPSDATLRKWFLDAVKASDGEGRSPRDLAKRHPGVDALTWMAVGAALNRAGLLAHSWRPCKAGGPMLQESLYLLPGTAP
jgi:hypothetical protein